IAHQVAQVVAEVQAGEVYRPDINHVGTPASGEVLDVAVVDRTAGVPAPVNRRGELVLAVAHVPEGLPARVAALPGGAPVGATRQEYLLALGQVSVGHAEVEIPACHFHGVARLDVET